METVWDFGTVIVMGGSGRKGIGLAYDGKAYPAHGLRQSLGEPCSPGPVRGHGFA